MFFQINAKRRQVQFLVTVIDWKLHPWEPTGSPRNCARFQWEHICSMKIFRVYGRCLELSICNYIKIISYILYKLWMAITLAVNQLTRDFRWHETWPFNAQVTYAIITRPVYSPQFQMTSCLPWGRLIEMWKTYDFPRKMIYKLVGFPHGLFLVYCWVLVVGCFRPLIGECSKMFQLRSRIEHP